MECAQCGKGWADAGLSTVSVLSTAWSQRMTPGLAD